ncbi:MAG: hypothetical protein GY908_08010 [Flavobacteriales bacterium]|nr:hypothetical protein [Flavobacteriales bacterium]
MNKWTFTCVFCALISFQLVGQSKNSRFSSLSSPEKWWVIWHPFKAKKALEVSLRALEVTDSIKKTDVIGRDIIGGHLDAFKHTFWMASMSQKIGQKSSLKLGRAHEKGNYQSFLEGRPEDGSLADKVSSDMDLFNNESGAAISNTFPRASESDLIHLVLEKLHKGNLRTIKKDGNVFLTCNGDPIPESSLIGNWENDKCLIPSNKP